MSKTACNRRKAVSLELAVPIMLMKKEKLLHQHLENAVRAADDEFRLALKLTVYAMERKHHMPLLLPPK